MVRNRVRRLCPTVPRRTAPPSRFDCAGLLSLPFLLLILLIMLVLHAPPAAAQGAGGPETFHRWGVGWDDGLALRRWFSPTWGMGLNLSPDWSENDYGYGPPPSVPEGPLPDRYENGYRRRDTAVTLLVFSESRLRPWLRVGPYATLSWEHVRYRWTYFSRSTGNWGEGDVTFESSSGGLETARNWTAEIGVRPSFRIHHRFILETRLGIRLSRVKGEIDRRDVATTRTETSEETVASEDHERSEYWRLTVLGRDLGPGAVMQFVILF